MGQALFERAANGRHTAASAGTAPIDRLHPEVVEVMNELGIDLSDRRPHKVERSDAEKADVVVRMGCGDECPYIPGKQYLDWEIEDPTGPGIDIVLAIVSTGLPVDQVRQIRDEIAGRVDSLLAELDDH
jgi:arsenate reductase